MKSLERPTEPQGMSKHIATIVVAATLAMGAWVLSSLNNVQTTLARIDATVTSVQQTSQDTSHRVDTMATIQATQSSDIAMLKQRITTLEQYHHLSPPPATE